MLPLLQQNQDKKFIVTTDNWFFAPDGKQYRAVWGKVRVYNSEDTLGIKTNVRSTNWYAVVGENDKEVVLAGCQIHYATVCNDKPFTGKVQEDKFSDAQGQFTFNRECFIYIAQ